LFAGVELEGLPAGEYRVLLGGEVKALRKRVEGKVKKISNATRPGSRPKPPKHRAGPKTEAKASESPEKRPVPRPKVSSPPARRAAPKVERPALAKRIEKKWKS
ncbi:MAG: hypothetical protein KY445_10545, partial [Armatimonadetes bacterium]|nr:hypothetical protein [Armatimonadota bacterium]